MLFLGIDVGSSSVKLSVLDGETGKSVAQTQYPATELAIASPAPGFAEQAPETWWECVCAGLNILKEKVDLKAISAIGIAYQMHGLVLVDEKQQVLRPAIIWCDSRAVPYGDEALEGLGTDYCYSHLLNAPGNFTAAKLRWVQANQPEIYANIHAAMLPGDYIAMRLSGVINTTATGLSEGTLWDYKARAPAQALLDHWGMSPELLPEIVPTLGFQSAVSDTMAEELGLNRGTPITYRAGDQPNNALSLFALEPGEVAATAGTSGVIYAVTDQPATDPEGRVNTFLHVSDTADTPRNGVLACVNGTGRAYSWLRQTLAQAGGDAAYPLLNELAEATPIGADGLMVLPFGNGAERLLQNRNLGAKMLNLDFNRHQLGHLVRATQEGIAFALNMGFGVLESIGAQCRTVKAGHSNLFLSPLFCEVFANTTGATVELYDTDGAEGAARAAAIGAGFYTTSSAAFSHLTQIKRIEPTSELTEHYQAAYQRWQLALEQALLA